MTTGQAEVHSAQTFDDRILTLWDCCFICWRSTCTCNYLESSLVLYFLSQIWTVNWLHVYSQKWAWMCACIGTPLFVKRMVDCNLAL